MTQFQIGYVIEAEDEDEARDTVALHASSLRAEGVTVVNQCLAYDEVPDPPGKPEEKK